MDRSPFPLPLPRFTIAFLAASLLALGSDTLSAQDAQDAQSAAEAPELYEWVLETYAFPSHSLASGFATPERGQLKAPPLPPDDATEDAVREFIRQSHSIAAHYLEKQGLSLPKGALVVFDPESLTLSARLPRISQSSLAFTAEAYQAAVSLYLEMNPSIVEAPAATLRDIAARATRRSDHAELLAELEEAAAQGGAAIVSQGRLESQSGARSALEQVRDTTAPFAFALGPNGEIEYSSETHPGGTSWEIDTVVGADGETIDLNLSLLHHYAPNARRPLPLTSTDDLAVATTVMDSYRATIAAQYTMRNGSTRLLGVWQPVWRPGDEGRGILQAAFLSSTVVRVLPLPNETLATLLAEHGEAVEPTPEGALEFERVADEIPEGMVVRRFVVPPSALTAPRATAGAGAADPFAAPMASEPIFAMQATAKDILASVGIPFPSGSSANYLRATSTLVVRNTPENMQMVEAYLFSLRSGTERVLRLAIHLVEGPGETLRQAARRASALPDHSRAWGELQEEEGVSIVSTHWAECQSGQRAKIEAGRETSVPSEARFEAISAPGQKGNQARNEGEGGNAGGARNAPAALTLAETLESERFGTSFVVDAVLGADGRTVDVNFSFLHDDAPPETSGEAQREPGSVRMEGPATTFHRGKVVSQTTFLSGAIRLVGMWRPTGTPEFEESDVLRAIFLQVDAVPAVEMAAEEAP